MRERAATLTLAFDVRGASRGRNTPSRAVSGGNQQKIVIARALADNPCVVVAVNPTRGLDVHAVVEVHAALRRAAEQSGAAVVLISTELDEVLALATYRVAVLYEGRFSGIVPPAAPRETFGLLMGGGSSGGENTPDEERT